MAEQKDEYLAKLKGLQLVSKTVETMVAMKVEMWVDSLVDWMVAKPAWKVLPRVVQKVYNLVVKRVAEKGRKSVVLSEKNSVEQKGTQKVAMRVAQKADRKDGLMVGYLGHWKVDLTVDLWELKLVVLMVALKEGK